MKTLLQIVTSVCGRRGLPKPASVINSANLTHNQMGFLANEVCADITSRAQWQGLTKEATWTTVSGEDQGSIYDLASGGFLYILNQTIFNRSMRVPFYGPLSPKEWQVMKVLPITGPFNQYRFRGDHLLMTPTPYVGHSCAFEYMSRMVVETTEGVGQEEFLADSDTFLLDEELLILGITWKYLRVKGMAYASENADYETRMADVAGRDLETPILRMDDASQTSMTPGIFVPTSGRLMS